MPPKSKFVLAPVGFKASGFMPAASQPAKAAIKTPEQPEEAAAEPEINKGPALYTKGSDDDTELFRVRSKVLRFNQSDKEWKERGVGDLCVFYDNKNKYTHVLMHREQTYKIAVNFAAGSIVEEPIFNPGSEGKAVFLVAQDYSDGEPKISTFRFMFKQAEDAEKYLNILKEARVKELNVETEQKEEKKEEKEEKKEEDVEEVPKKD